jgi:Nucleoside transporter
VLLIFVSCMDLSRGERRLPESSRIGHATDTSSKGGESPVQHYPIYDSIERLAAKIMATGAVAVDNGGENDVGGDLPLQNLQTPTSTSQRARVEETFLFFVGAVGSTIGWTAVLSNLVFYTETLGVNSYLYLNLCTYAPLLPISIAQTLWDADFDRHFTSLRSFAVRGNVGFAVTLVSVILLAPASANHSLTQVSLLSLCLGTVSGILQGALKQMASFVYPGCGRLAAAVTAGLQASAVGILAVSLVTPIQSSDDNASWLYEFYVAIAVLVAICWLGFQRLMTRSQDVYRSMLRRDSSIQLSALGQDDDDDYNCHNPEAGEQDLVNDIIGGPMSSGSTDQDDDDDDDDDGERMEQPLLSSLGGPTQHDMPTMTELFWTSWPLCLATFLTVASSMAVAAWFNRVPSAHPSMTKILPQILFYTRLFADLLSRPCTLWLPHPDEQDPKQALWYIMVFVFIRLLFAPYFFLYCTTTALFPRSDMVMILGVFGFAFSSGFINTWVYQLAPRYCVTVVDGQETQQQQQHPNDDIVLKQTNLLNVCFSLSILFGLMGSLGLSGFGMSHDKGMSQ